MPRGGSSAYCSRPLHGRPRRAGRLKENGRREAPVILTVDAAAMHAAGHAFYQAANGVWLTDRVHGTDGYVEILP